MVCIIGDISHLGFLLQSSISVDWHCNTDKTYTDRRHIENCVNSTTGKIHPMHIGIHEGMGEGDMDVRHIEIQRDYKV